MLLHEYDVDYDHARHFPSPGKCIYCGKSDVRLTDEHVIPYAIGKDATILDKSDLGDSAFNSTHFPLTS